MFTLTLLMAPIGTTDPEEAAAKAIAVAIGFVIIGFALAVVVTLASRGEPVLILPFVGDRSRRSLYFALALAAAIALRILEPFTLLPTLAAALAILLFPRHPRGLPKKPD